MLFSCNITKLIETNSSMLTWMSQGLFATNWEVLDRTGFKFSGSAVVYLTMLSI